MTTAHADGLAAPRSGRGLVAVAVVTVVAIALGAIALAGLPRVGEQPRVEFLAISVDSAVADRDRSVTLALRVDNARPAPLTATVRVASRAAGGTEQVRWSATVTAPRGAAGSASVVLPDACGQRLAVQLESAAGSRSLDLRVPCVAAGPTP